MSGTGKNRLILLALLAVFIVPWLFAYFWSPTRFKNQGELILPARPLAAQGMRFTGAGDPETENGLWGGKWTLLTFESGGCDDACIEKITRMGASRLAQGKNAHRVQSILLRPEAFRDTGLAGTGETPDWLNIVTAPDAPLAAFKRQFPAAAAGEESDDRIFLIDPQGNLMMQYDSRHEDDAIANDLRRLLRVSHIG